MAVCRYLGWEEQDGPWLRSHRHFFLPWAFNPLPLGGASHLHDEAGSLVCFVRWCEKWIWWGRPFSWQQEILPVLTWIEMSSVGLAISCYFAIFSLIETSLSLCLEASQSDRGRSKGLCSGIPVATYDQSQFSKRVLVPNKFKLGLQTNWPGYFVLFFIFSFWSFFFLFESWIILVVFSVVPRHSLSLFSYQSSRSLPWFMQAIVLGGTKI